MEKKNPTKMDTSETEKKRIQKGQGKREKKNPKNPGAKTSSERTNRNPGGPKKEQEKSFQREKRGFKILGKEKPKKGTESKRTPSSLKRPTKGVNGMKNP